MKYVTPTTTLAEIKAQLKAVNEQLEGDRLTEIDRLSLEDEVTYLESFIPVERW